MPVPYQRVNHLAPGLPTQGVHPGLQFVVLRNVGNCEVSSAELYDRVVGDYGTVNKRTFYRHLEMLRRTGRVQAKLEGLMFWYRRA